MNSNVTMSYINVPSRQGFLGRIQQCTACTSCLLDGDECALHKPPFQLYEMNNNNGDGTESTTETIHEGGGTSTQEQIDQRCNAETNEKTTSVEHGNGGNIIDECRLETKFLGFDQKGRPCKMCLRRKGLCFLHEMKRERGAPIQILGSQKKSEKVFGITKRGKACTICIYEGDFCSLHKEQKQALILSELERSASASFWQRIFYLLFLVMTVYEVFFIGYRFRENMNKGLEVVSRYGQFLNNILETKTVFLPNVSLQGEDSLGYPTDRENISLHEDFDLVAKTESNDTDANHFNLSHGSMFPAVLDYDSVVRHFSRGIFE